MADQFKLQEAITFVQQTPPESYRLMDILIIDLPQAYAHGKVSVPAAAVDLEVVTDVNIFVLNCATGVTLKIGNTTNPPLTNVTQFSYKGNKTTFYVSNTGTEDINVDYASCSL